MRLLKIMFWTLFILAALFLYWFLPKYNYIKSNPQFCINITSNLYYCGTHSNIQSVYNIFKK